MSVWEWFDCLQQFILHSANSTFRPDDDHLCSSECEMFCYKPQFFVCKTTGRVHMCAPQQCNRLERLREHIVCQVTAIVYPSDIPLTSKGEHESYKDELDLQREALRKKRKVNQKTIEQETREHKIKAELEQIRLSKPEQKLTREESKAYRQRLPYHRKETLFDREKLYTDALILINKLFGPKLIAVKARVDFGQLSHCLVEWWVMTQTNLRQNSTERSEYSFQDHVLACMYVIKDGGLTRNGENVIPSIVPIAENIIQQKSLKHILNNNSSTGNNRSRTKSRYSRRITNAIKILRKHI